MLEATQASAVRHNDHKRATPPFSLTILQASIFVLSKILLLHLKQTCCLFPSVNESYWPPISLMSFSQRVEVAVHCKSLLATLASLIQPLFLTVAVLERRAVGQWNDGV